MEKPKLSGVLPKGNWRFCLVEIQGQPDVIVVADYSGQNAPRMVVNGKLVEFA